MSDEQHDTIDALMAENRKFPPSEAFRANALVRDTSLYDEAAEDDEGFWARQAGELLRWTKEWDTILDWRLPDAKWFVGGELNVADNCLDRHVQAGLGERVAIHWEGEPGDTRTITYAELLDEVSKFSNVLKGLGVEKGDRVMIYMPMIPEAAVAMLACARIGAPHSVVFGGFSAQSLTDRIDDADAKLLVTADGGYRRGEVFPLKPACDEAVENTSTIEHVVVVKRGGNDVTMVADRDHWYHDLMDGASADCPAEPMDSEDLLFLLYTSGTTGKPKGIMHTMGGYLTHVTFTHRYVFDLHPETDVFWCTADVGWITGHSYIVYGPLSNGMTCVLYEGAPNHPDWGRFWNIVDKHRVTTLYTAPTAIRTFIRQGTGFLEKADLSSLRLLGTVGEPINPEVWVWYHEQVGRKRCPIVDTWWQTETGAIMMTTLPGAHFSKPGSTGLPFFGVEPAVVTSDGKSVAANQGGLLVVRRPWPSMLRTIWGDDERFSKQYFSDIKGVYFTGDGARCDEEGYFHVVGRIDDVLNVSGHRIGTAEIESVLVAHPAVAEAAAVGRPDELKGQALVVFVTLKPGHDASDAMKRTLSEHVGKEIGKFARPDDVRFADGLPKTRSGKIMRRLLKDVAAGREAQGDISTLEDLSVLAKLRQDEE